MLELDDDYDTPEHTREVGRELFECAMADWPEVRRRYNGQYEETS